MVIGGGSGLPYSIRHWAASKTDNFWGHRILGFVEAIPVLGAIIALIEGVVSLFFSKQGQCNNPRVKPRSRIFFQMVGKNADG